MSHSITTLLNRSVSVLFVLLLTACGGGESTASEGTEGKKSNKIVASKCDKIIEDYDRLVVKSIEFAEAQMEGKEIDEAEQEKITKEAQVLAQKIQNLGLVGIGGQPCYDEFVKIQLKWSEAAVELQQKAIEKVMQQMEGQQ